MTRKLTTLTDGLVSELKDLYSAEHQLLKILPKMEKKATNQKLKEAFHEHILETEDQVARLEDIGKVLVEKLSGKTCKAMQGLVEEGHEVIEEESENAALIDVLLIGAARRVEHYEIAAYATARMMALELGHEEIADLLDESLDEEIDTEKGLSSIQIDEALLQEAIHSNSELEDFDPEPAQNPSRMKKLGGAAKLLSFAIGVALCYQFVASVFADNMQSKSNRETRITAEDQNQGRKELELLARIRREIVSNDKLSINAQNIKIVIDHEKVVLRGAVRSEEEKSSILKTVEHMATGYTIVSHLEITPS